MHSESSDDRSTDSDSDDGIDHNFVIKKLKPGSTVVKLDPRLLTDDFKCMICLEVMQEATCVMECLHRFCSECIETALRHGKKQCPACRVGCASRRNLRKDPDFDHLIKLVRDGINAIEQRRIDRAADVMKGVNMVETLRTGWEQQKENTEKKAAPVKRAPPKPLSSRPAKRVKPTPSVPAPPTNSKRSKQSENKRISKKSVSKSKPAPPAVAPQASPYESPIDCVLDSMKDTPSLRKRYLRTSSMLTVKGIRKFIARKLEQREDNVVVFVNVNDKTFKVADHMSLDNIRNTYGNMRLLYKFVT